MLTLSRQGGVTLIELMIGLAIFGMLVMMALPSYTAWIHNTRIRNAAESVQNGLQLARAEAVRRNTDVQFVFGTDSDWSVSVVAPAATVQSRSSAQGSAGVTVAKVPIDATRVTFNSLGRIAPNANGSASFTQADFDVPTSVLPAATSRDLRITVSSGGRIRMCDPSVTDTSDTRSC
jgi:type IV fimbrial biogenesis protein FimT